MHPHSKTDTAQDLASPQSTGWFGRVCSRWNDFWFTPADRVSLHVPRVLFGIVFLANLLANWGQHQALLGLDGWFDRQAYIEGVQIQGAHPNLTGWSPLFIAATDTLLTVLYAGSIAAVALFTLGIATRLTGVLTWLAAVAFTTNPASSFGGDALLLIFSLYLMLGYLFLGLRSSERSISTWLGNWGPRTQLDAPPSVAAGTVLRLMQVHVAIMLITSGLHKLQIGAWWAGVPLWFPLHPAFETTLSNLNFNSPNAYMVWLSLGAYAILAWQISFPFVAWRPSFRWVVLSGGLIAAIGCPLVYGLPLFGGLTLVGCLAFVQGSEYRRMLGQKALPATSEQTPAVARAHGDLALQTKSVA